MKSIRVLLRLALLSLVAAGFVGLTYRYERAMHPLMPSPSVLAERLHRRADEPQAAGFVIFVAEGGLLTLCALVGRIGLRLRLSPPPRNEGQMTFLELHQERSARHEISNRKS